MKKIYTIILVAFFFFFFLTGCNSSATDKNANPSESSIVTEAPVYSDPWLLLTGPLTVQAKVWDIQDGCAYMELSEEESITDHPDSFYMEIETGEGFEEFSKYDIVEITFNSYKQGEYMPYLEGVNKVTVKGSFVPPTSPEVLPDVIISEESRNHILQVCDENLDQNIVHDYEQVTNRDNPLLEVISVLPEQYYMITEPQQSEYYYRVTYETDNMLGSIVFYLDKSEIVVGTAYRD